MSRTFRLLTACLAALLVTTAACAETADDPPSRPAPDAPTTGETAPDRIAADHPHPAYARLEEALRRYRRIADRGGWPTVPPGDLLEPGDTSDRVVDVRRRLAATGDLAAANAAESGRAYTEALAEAVRHFQRRHGLLVDGLVGSGTRAALNVPVEDRIAAIELNLQRWESLPDTLGRRYILVNIPEFRLRAYRDDEVALAMDVIVGAEYDGRATPVFQDRMEHVVVNPYWNIPQSIAEEEILPEARQDVDYLAEHDYQIVTSYAVDARVLDPRTTDLDRVASGELRLRQEPGPGNALGRIKFIFPNDYAIYLHGTPEDQLFEEAERDFSHGCIRVADPVGLADFVFAENPEWSGTRIDSAIATGERQKIELGETIPVYIYYWTAFVDEDGTVQFRKDIYSLDRESFDL